jgi:hypothetical protein
MMVFGPPGIGKSTLLAKFVLDHARSPGLQIPFVYADFERPTLSVIEPTTLLAEAARQLATQYPSARNQLDALAEQADEETLRQRVEQVHVEELEDVSVTRGAVRRGAARDLRMGHVGREEKIITELAAVLIDAVLDTSSDLAPLLIVLDSFEKAQYRRSPYLSRIWNVLTALQDRYALVRIVVSGRAAVEDLTVGGRSAVYHRVDELDPTARIGFLRAQGVEDTAVAALLGKSFGGNPLSLKLAAKVGHQMAR